MTADPYVEPPLPDGMTAQEREELWNCARQAGEQSDAMLRSFSGADQADSYAYSEQRRVYVEVGLHGFDVLERELEAADKRWRDYAAKQAAKVDAAPKIKRGPSRGHSAISHRWVSPDKFAGMMGHIRAMVRICRERATAKVSP